MEHDATAVGTGFWAPFRQVFGQWHLARRLIIVSSLFIWQNGTGINAINCTWLIKRPRSFSALTAPAPKDYSPTIFKSLGVTGTNTSLLTTGIFGIMKTIFALIWAFVLIDRWGRRPLLLLGSVGGSLSMAYLAAYIAIGKPEERPVGSPVRLSSLFSFYLTADHRRPPTVRCRRTCCSRVRIFTSMTIVTVLPTGISALSYFPKPFADGSASTSFFYIWTAFYSISWNGTPWVINAESFPGSIRTVTQTLAATSNWFWVSPGSPSAESFAEGWLVFVLGHEASLLLAKAER